MRKKLFFYSTLVVLFAMKQDLAAQTVTYTDYKAPVYRFAENQRFSNHKSIFFVSDINADLLDNLLSSKKDNSIDLFRGSIIQELSKAGIATPKDTGDLVVAFLVNRMSLSPIAGNTFTPTYNVEGEIQEVVINKKGEPYSSKTIKISQQESLASEDQISNDFTKLLANARAVDVYRIIVKHIKSMSFQRQKTFIDGYQMQSFNLPVIYRAKKKYPELASLDSLNDDLVANLKKKDTKDYAQLIKPYEQSYLQLLAQPYPSDYNMKQIKVAGYSELAFLYYLAYDTVQLKKSLDTLYAYSSKFLGTRADYSNREPLLKEISGYYTTLNERKYPLDSSSGEIRSNMFSTEKVSAGWVLLSKGDTIKGKYIDEKMSGSIVNLDEGKYVKFEIIEKDKTVRKNYKLSDVTSFGILGKSYEIHKFKPVFEQNNAVSFDMLRSKSYPFEILYSSAKIRILKENFGEGATNAIVFIRPNETEVANQGRDWFKKKAEMMKEYFKDCPEMLAKLDAATYDFKSDNSYIKMAEDYTNSCK
ncbi:hypothetical protein SAMN05428988_2497 [Chitinophaga sp. YR573]|uniref:hypothetical protein n=1 Tax=Chitinophaga sp. YR573 TaxID=1881040 RepID=UPI0008C600D7|nr:hypothetical protein [Chitinophaga sp. YR573]SEW14879.1 hypothetical protein SAMN05428988_2497 [Chitinophaga sp. YR573]